MNTNDEDQEIEDFCDVQEDLREAFTRLEDWKILEHLAHYAASVLSQYEPGESRDEVISYFAKEVQYATDFFDEYDAVDAEIAAEDDGILDLGEVLDVIASYALEGHDQTHLSHAQAVLRAKINEHFGIDLPLYPNREDDDQCPHCGIMQDAI